MNGKRKRRDAFITTLRDGTKVLLRPVTAQDRDRLQKGISMLSNEARYLRFFGPVSNLSEKQLEELTNVDQFNHVAWGAMDPKEIDFPGFGVGRFVRLEDDPSIAEGAVTVIDAYQGKGLGTIFVALMYILALEGGVKLLRGIVMPENNFFIKWMSDLGANTQYQDGYIKVEVVVREDFSLLPRTPSGQRFKRALDHVQQALYHIEEGDYT